MADKIPSWALVTLNGKPYETVAWRIVQFREKYPDHLILTDVRQKKKDGAVVALLGFAAIYAKGDQDPIATGHSAVAAGKPNAVELAETKAVGRALAFFGLGGQHIASKEEMEEFEEDRLVDYIAAVRDNWDTINAVKTFLATDDIDAAREAYHELEPETQIYLWRAPTKGGVFTTRERDQLKGIK